MNNITRQVKHALTGKSWDDYPYKTGDKIIVIETGLVGVANSFYRPGDIGTVNNAKDLSVEFEKENKVHRPGTWYVTRQFIRPYTE